jgi:hypothetical protein
VADLMVTRGLARSMLEPVQGALAGERRAPSARAVLSTGAGANLAVRPGTDSSACRRDASYATIPRFKPEGFADIAASGGARCGRARKRR